MDHILLLCSLGVVCFKHFKGRWGCSDIESYLIIFYTQKNIPFCSPLPSKLFFACLCAPPSCIQSLIIIMEGSISIYYRPWKLFAFPFFRASSLFVSFNNSNKLNIVWTCSFLLPTASLRQKVVVDVSASPCGHVLWMPWHNFFLTFCEDWKVSVVVGIGELRPRPL